jgi:hypothetical protein
VLKVFLHRYDTVVGCSLKYNMYHASLLRRPGESVSPRGAGSVWSVPYPRASK